MPIDDLSYLYDDLAIALVSRGVIADVYSPHISDDFVFVFDSLTMTWDAVA